MYVNFPYLGIKSVTFPNFETQCVNLPDETRSVKFPNFHKKCVNYEINESSLRVGREGGSHSVLNKQFKAYDDMTIDLK